MKKSMQITTVKGKIYYSVEELMSRGWTTDDIQNLLGQSDSRKRSGRISLTKFFYSQLYLIGRVHRIEQTKEFQNNHQNIDSEIQCVFSEHNEWGEERFFARLKDNRVFGGTYNTGFHSEAAMKSCHKLIFGPTSCTK